MIIFRIIFIIFIVLKFRLDEFFKLRKNSLLSILLYPLSLIKPKKNNRAIRLRLALESLGPIFIKFGQMLSTRKDLLPNDIAIELSKLQDKVPPFEFEKVKQTIENAYSKKISSVFKEFNEKPVASASVAQVHFAILHNGEKVAVKILRPNIESEVKKDIKLLHLIANILYKIWSDGKRLKPDEVVSEFERHTQSELNLLLEAGHCSHLGENFKDKKLLVVPNVFWDYCHEKVMVMERMDGIPISNIDVIKKNKINLSELAKNGVEIFFTQVFRDGFFHADMHPGNIQVAKSGKYIAMDFGIMGTLNDQDKLYLAKNFAAFFKRDYREVARVHIESGWVPSETSIDEFENAIRSVCEPIFNKPLKDISFGKLLIRLFQTSKKFNMEIQPQLTMLQKTLLNVEGLGRELDPNLDLWVTARPFLENWLKEQIGPKNLINRIKKEFPNWVDIAPQLPTLLHAYLNNHNKDSYTIIEKDIRKSIEGIKLRQDRIILVMILLFVVITLTVLTFI
jgi:ubiquinone biosynthesis protein